jgi:hypothetical protein
MNTVMNLPSIQKCQVLLQDIALELTRLDKRLGKINRSGAALASLPLQAELAERICELRRKYLQQAALQLLGLAQRAAEERLQSSSNRETGGVQGGPS